MTRVVGRDDLAETEVIVSLDAPTTRPDVLYGAARSLAHEADLASLGGVRVAHDPPAFVGLGGASNALDPSSVFVAVGSGFSGIRGTIERGLAEHRGHAVLVPGSVGRAETERYAYVQKRFARTAPRLLVGGSVRVVELARNERGDRCLLARGPLVGAPLAELVPGALGARDEGDAPPEDFNCDFDVRWSTRNATAGGVDVAVRIALTIDAETVSALSESSVVARVPDAFGAVPASGAREPCAVLIVAESGAVYLAARFQRGELLNLK
ncbi:MAG: hypothetical protein IPJ34_19605 [Myxococcales bacterium]|nr:hypothetical protein [Myxococcales bacterium]